MLFRHPFIAFVVVFLAGAVAVAAPLRLGVLTDIHAHDMDSPAEHKVMTNYMERIHSLAAAMKAWPADAVVELGDFVNGAYVMMGAPIEDLAGAPARIAGILAQGAGALLEWGGPTHFVVGNHDVYTLTKSEFLAAVGLSSTTWSFDLGGFHFVGLDAEFKKTGEDVANAFWFVQGTLPQAEMEWLKRDLASTPLPTVVFIHQPLDELHDLGGPSISNWSEAQAVLSASGRVIAVFQGHMHESKHNVIDGILYVTFAAMVDSDVSVPPSWAAVTLDAEARTVRIDGAGLQEDLEFTY